MGARDDFDPDIRLEPAGLGIRSGPRWRQYINGPPDGGRIGGYIYVLACAELAWSGEIHGTRQ